MLFWVTNHEIYSLFIQKRAVFNELGLVSISLYMGIENRGLKRGILGVEND